MININKYDVKISGNKSALMSETLFLFNALSKEFNMSPAELLESIGFLIDHQDEISVSTNESGFCLSLGK